MWVWLERKYPKEAIKASRTLDSKSWSHRNRCWVFITFEVIANFIHQLPDCLLWLVSTSIVYFCSMGCRLFFVFGNNSGALELECREYTSQTKESCPRHLWSFKSHVPTSVSHICNGCPTQWKKLNIHIMGWPNSCEFMPWRKADSGFDNKWRDLHWEHFCWWYFCALLEPDGQLWVNVWVTKWDSSNYFLFETEGRLLRLRVSKCFLFKSNTRELLFLTFMERTQVRFSVWALANEED